MLLTKSALNSQAKRLSFPRISALHILSFITLFIVGAAFMAPNLIPYDHEAMGVGPRLSSPSTNYWLGTDEFGRDIFSRIVMGMRLTLMVGLVSVGMSLSSGLLIGLIAGYFGGWLEKIMMRSMDVLFSFTEIVIALSLVAVLGPSLENAMIAIGISAIPFYSRVCYSAVLVEKGQVYVESAIAIGASSLRILFVHILPNVLPIMIVVATIGLSNAILATSGLSYLGLGAQPPSPEWGAMLSASKNFFQRAPWLLYAPGISIIFIVILFNLLGEQLRAVLDPSGKGGK